MKLYFSDKTYYAMGLLAAAFSMANALMVLTGTAYSLLDSAALGLNGLMFLFLAAGPKAAKAARGWYFLCFLVLYLSVTGLGGAFWGYLFTGLYWPLFIWGEARRQPSLAHPARMVTGAEIFCFAFRLCVFSGLESYILVANLFWLFCTLARGWACLCLYRLAVRE